MPPLPLRLALAFGAGLIGAIPGGLAIAGLGGARTRLRQRAQLLAAAGPPKVPEDGEFGPFFGRLVATGPTLVAPLSGRRCAMYRYQAAHSSGGSHSSEVVDVEGYALTPSHLDTLAGRIHLFAFMEAEFTPDTLDPEPARERLRAYLPTVELFQPSLDLMRNYRENEKQVLDADGSIRFDHGRPDGVETARYFHEHIVEPGDEVAVFGLYSAARQGIVPDPADEIRHRARLRKGPLRRLARGFVLQALASAIVGLLFAAAFGFWIRLFFRSAATFWS